MSSVLIASAPAPTLAAPARRGPSTMYIARKGCIVLGIRLGGAAVAFALQIVLARALGQLAYGEYAYVFAWMQLLLIFANGGFSTAAVRYVSEYRARRDPATARGFLKRSSQIVIVESIGLALLMAGCAVALDRFGTPGSPYNFLIASIALPVLAQFGYSAAVIRGLGHATMGVMIAQAHPLFLLAGLAASGYLVGLPLTASHALYLNLAAAAGSLTLVFLLRRRLEQKLDASEPPAFRTREWYGTAKQLMIVAALMYLQGRTGVILCGIFLDAKAAATYAAMERLADAALIGSYSVSLFVAPRFASLHAQGRKHDLERNVRWAAWGSSAFMFAAVVPLFLFGKIILQFFGDGFVMGYPALLILLAGVCVNAVCGPVCLLLNMTGHQRDTVAVALVSLVVNLGLSLALIPIFGIIGTAVANAAAMVFWNIAMLIITRRRLDIWACIGQIKLWVPTEPVVHPHPNHGLVEAKQHEQAA